MGVKSTVQLTRQEALEKYADLKMRAPDVRRRLKAEAMGMDKRELEDELMELNDAAAGGEGYENYTITDE